MSIAVIDPFGVVSDPQMPFLARALNPVEVQRHFAGGLARLSGEKGQFALRAIRVTRYKAARRCLIEYDLEVERPHTRPEVMTLIGKARARGLDESSYDLVESLWNGGFASDSTDGLSVPEPIGIVREFHMWLQRKVPGTVATRLLAEPGGVALARRIAEGAHKLHQLGVLRRRSHTMADELRILHDRLSLVARMHSQWAQRLERILDACDRLGAATPRTRPCGIHRDFYPDQVLVDGARLYLLDLDLYCEGDPGLDIGNFLGHLTEQSLRTLGDPTALVDRETVLEEHFVNLSGAVTRPAVRAYTTLTLVRHVYLSTQFLERRQFTEALLELCEQRLGLGAPAGKPALADAPRPPV